jgi:conjugal transfer/type IV secretion protein DotA/TraY
MITWADVANGVGHDTYALDYLRKFLGDAVLFGTSGADALRGPVSILGAMMQPAFAGLLALIVLFVMGAGIVKTATEGRFLGKSWDHVGTPARLVLAVVLIASPGVTGISMSQMLYTRALLLGNNAADVVWREIITRLQADKLTGTTGGTQGDGSTEFLPLIKSRFLAYMPVFICDEQLKQDRFTERTDYKSLRADVCGVPDFVINGTDKNVTNTPAPGLNSTSATVDVNLQRQAEYVCFRDVFDSRINGKILKWNKENSLMPPDSLKKEDAEIVWKFAMDDAAGCVYEKYMARSSSFNAENAGHTGIAAFFLGSTSSPDYAYNKGWAGAALRGDLASQQVGSYRAKYQETRIPSPDLGKLPSTDGLGLTQGAINGTIQAIQKFTAANARAGFVDEEKFKTASRTGGDKLDDMLGSGLLFLSGKVLADNAGKAGAVAEDFLKSPEYLRAAGAALIAAAEANQVADLTLQEAKDAEASSPILGTFAGPETGVLSLTKKIATIALTFPGVKTFIFGLGIFLTSAPVLPQAVMIAALFIWLIRAMAWFLMIPFGVVMMAIPESQAGHDIWKEAISVALTPVLIILFYFVGSIANGMLIDISSTLVFGYYIDHGFLALVWDVLTGEAIARLVIFIALVIFGFVMLSWIILRGPDMIFRALGLRGSFSDLGSEMENVGNKIGLS